MSAFAGRNSAKRLSDLPFPADDQSVLQENLAVVINRYDKQVNEDKLQVIGEVVVNSQGKGTACKLTEGTGIAKFDAEICEVTVQSMRWHPATDAFGDPAAGNGALRLRLVFHED